MRGKEYNWLEDKWLHEMLFRMNSYRAAQFTGCMWWEKMGDRKNALIRAKDFAWFQAKYEYYRNRLEELQRTK